VEGPVGMLGSSASRHQAQTATLFGIDTGDRA
jgi:hypothetical protein